MLLVRRELRCGAKLGAAEKLMLLVLRGRSESRSCPPSRGSSVGSGDRLPTAKQMAAMAGAISGAKVSSGQCFRGFAARTWRNVERAIEKCRWIAIEKCRWGLVGPVEAST